MSRIGSQKERKPMPVVPPLPDPKDTENSESTSDEDLEFLNDSPHRNIKALDSPVERRRGSFLGLGSKKIAVPTGKKVQPSGSFSMSLEDILSQTQSRRLAACLKELKEGNPEELILVDMKLSIREVKRLFSALKKYYRRRQKNDKKLALRSLELRNCGIDDNVCNIIADAILSIGFTTAAEFQTGLQKLDLSHNDITTRGALLILGALKQNTDLTEVILVGNDIAEGVGRWMADQLAANQQAKKEQAFQERHSLKRLKKEKRNKSSDNIVGLVSSVSFDFVERGDKEKTPPNTEALRTEAEKLTAQVQALRAEIKRLETKRAKMKKKVGDGAFTESETSGSPPDSPTLPQSNMFKLVDSTKIKIGRRIAPLGGSGASIFEAEVDGWTCALKEIVNIKYMNKATITSFEREIKIMGSLPSHPNVCRFLFASRENNTIRLFMSLYHSTLATIIKNKSNAIQKASEHHSLVHQSSLSRIFSVLTHQGSSDSDGSWSNRGDSTGSSTPRSASSSTASSPIAPSFLISAASPRDKSSTPRGKTPRYATAERVASFIESQYFQPKQIQFYALEVASGIEFLHSNNVIHRDIKSENIFVQYDMENNIKSIAIGDFDTALNTILYRPRTICGTTAFMAPEVFRGQEYSELADIFSFGVVLYSLLTFELPWGRQTTVVNYEERLSKPIEYPVRILNSEYSPLAKICTRCLSIDPAERPTAKQLKELLASA